MKKWALLGFVILSIVALDILTKQWALENLHFGVSSQLWGLLPVTLTFNEGGGFSLSFGANSRWIFIAVATAILVILMIFYARTPLALWVRRLALAMIMAGAIGNLIDRIRWDQGVVDFIGPIDLGFMLWPIFNLADSAVSTGGVLLVLTLWWREKRAQVEESSASPETSQSA